MVRAADMGLKDPISAYADTATRILEPLQEGFHFLCVGTTALPDVTFEGKTYRSFKKVLLRDALQTMPPEIQPDLKNSVTMQTISQAILDLMEWDEQNRKASKENNGNHLVSIIDT